MPGLDVQAIRDQFPILSRKVYGRPLVYLDSGASAQKPLPVLETIDRTYRHEYANVHRGLHYLSNHATEAYEGARGKIARFLGAYDEEEIVYVRSTTEAINLVASSWLEPRIQEGDEIVLSVLEHHANIVPWHFLRERRGAVLKWVDIGDDGSLDPVAVERALGARTRFVALTHMSNVLGTRVDIAAISEMTRSRASRSSSMAASRPCISRWMSLSSGATSIALPDTSYTARLAPAPSTVGESTWRKCAHSLAEAT